VSEVVVVVVQGGTMETDRPHHIGIAVSHLIQRWLDLDDGREVFTRYSRGEMTAHVGI